MSNKIKNVIDSVKNGIQLLALIVLVIEALLLASVVLVPETQRYPIVMGMAITFGLAIIGIVIVVFKQSETTDSIEMITDFDYSVFIAAPMSSVGESRFNELVAIVTKLKDAIHRDNRSLKGVTFAGMSQQNYGNWNLEDSSLRLNKKRIMRSERFLLFYPDKVPSSVFVESGIAIANDKKLLIMCKNKSDLPFLLKGIDSGNYISAKICEYVNDKEIEKMLLKYSKWFFGNDIE